MTPTEEQLVEVAAMGLLAREHWKKVTPRRLAAAKAQVRRAIATRERAPFKRVVTPFDPRLAEEHTSELWHGSRDVASVVLDGYEAKPIDAMHDSDPVGEGPPMRWWERWSYAPPMSAVSRAQNKGYDFGYSFISHWRPALFDWYAGLPATQQEVVSRAVGAPARMPTKRSADRDETADELGSLRLIFVTESRRLAESYGHGVDGGVFEVDTFYAQALDIIEDDLQGEQSSAIICPPDVRPQIGWKGLRYVGREEQKP